MYKNRKIYLLSFYSLSLYPSSCRFFSQACEFNIFDNILLYNEYNLPKDEKFDKILKDKLKSDIRGFGYWCWKPFIVLKTLEDMENNDILVYADIGCHLSKDGINRFYEYLDMVIEYESICSTLGFKEKQFTKSDIFNYFNVLNDINITDTFQRPATFFILEKTSSNIEFVRKWLNVFYDDFSLVDDSPSKIKNFDGFIENRHDQSIFSVLSKIFNIKTIDTHEFDSNNYKYPILFKRDKKDIYDFIINFSNCPNIIKNVSWLISSSKYREMLRKYIKLNLKEFIVLYFKENKNVSKFKYIKSGNLFLDIIIRIIFNMLKNELLIGIENTISSIIGLIKNMSKYGDPFNI
ncbi:hypothetical protein [uncultured Brachyspira sp.]|uniref:hypothetical protein n=1 Tax=uncultured Brachyspira sp. TaxID=221953 RepID=UPI0026245BC9|nr:hypothetical protein [uncultured Brachyspira sp.]